MKRWTLLLALALVFMFAMPSAQAITSGECMYFASDANVHYAVLSGNRLRVRFDVTCGSKAVSTYRIGVAVRDANGDVIGELLYSEG